MKEIYLREFVCPKCNIHITWALPKATVICTLCGRKVNKMSMKKQNPASLPPNGDQLVLFADEEN